MTSARVVARCAAVVASAAPRRNATTTRPQISSSSSREIVRVATRPRPPRRSTIARGAELSWDEAEELGVLELDFGSEHASVKVDVVDAKTAVVRVVAPDRPGLCADVVAALTDAKFLVAAAEVKTADESADDKFTIKLSDDFGHDFADDACFVDGDGGVCGTMIEKVERLVMEAAIEQWSYSTPKEASYVNSKDRVVEPSVCVTVVDSSLTKSGKCAVVALRCTDRKGLLVSILKALNALDAHVVSASVETTGEGVAENRFVVTLPEGLGGGGVQAAVMKVLTGTS